MSGRNYIFRVIAGAYLGYLGFTLVRDVLRGAEGSQPLFAFAGVAFIIIAATLLLSVARNYMKEKNNPDPTPVDLSGDTDVEEAPDEADEDKSADAAEEIDTIEAVSSEETNEDTDNKEEE